MLHLSPVVPSLQLKTRIASLSFSKINSGSTAETKLNKKIEKINFIILNFEIFYYGLTNLYNFTYPALEIK